MVKLLITDLDQTLLRDDGTISDYTKETLKQCQKKGILVGVATARIWANVMHIQKSLNADLLICSNGSFAMYRDEVIFQETIEAEKAEKLTVKLNELSSMKEIMVEGEKEVFINTRRFQPPHPLAKAIYTDFEGGLRMEARQIFASIENNLEAEQIKKEFPWYRCLHYRDGSRYAFMKHGVSKENAIRTAAEKIKISMQEIVAFGDDTGDIEMLKMCGLGVAVKNALPLVKEHADAVTDKNERDGVAVFLEHNLLRG